MSNATYTPELSIHEAANVILHCPEVCFLVEGPMGTGKSAIPNIMLSKLNAAEYHLVYLDCASLFEGDLALGAINHEEKLTEFYANAILGLHLGKKLIFLLDEYTKAPRSVRNMMHTILEVNMPRVAGRPIPEGSYRILTGNLLEEGVGDVLEDHTLNRITRLRVRKSNAEEWLAWAVQNNINPVIMAWADRHPHAFASFLDGGQDENEFIHNPRRVKSREQSVTGRSLEKVSKIVDVREHLSTEELKAALCGTVGRAGGFSILSFIQYQDQMPSWDVIIKDPKGAKLPENPNACAVMAFSAIRRVDKDTIAAFMEYLDRMSTEFQAMFAINIAKDSTKQSVAFSSKAFRDWCTANEDLL